MNYTKREGMLQIIGKQDFNPQHILECGQIFCFQKDGEKFKVWSADKFAVVEETPNGFDILTKDVDYFENFFDLKTDYSAIKAELAKHEIMREPIKFGQGIRILKNDAFEVLISFIISANNNIKRIQKTIFAMNYATISFLNLLGYVLYGAARYMGLATLAHVEQGGIV